MSTEIPAQTKLKAMRALAVFAIVVTVGYLAWRLAFTLAPDALWLSIPFLLLEVHGAISLGLFVFSVWDTEASTVPEPVTQTDLSLAVLIPTYNEDPEVLLPTVAAAVALEPAHETWVLDDGAREWVRKMAQELGAIYLARTDNTHAKAGNLNNALQHITADLVGVLDADHVPAAGFLTNTIGYFEDEELALVQTPQDFYNTDSFEHFGEYQEEAMFYRVIQPGKNRYNAAFWCGTSAVIRTSALHSVGGVAVESLTEDLHTTMRLHRKGWKTVFHNEVLARGLAPASYLEYAVQRRRWGAGAMQIIRSDNPILKGGLTIKQKIAYAATLSGWFEGLRTLGYFVLSLAVVITGTAPLSAPLAVFVPLYGVVFLAQQFAMLMLSRGRHSFGAGVLFDYFRLPSSIRALGRLLVPNGAKFLVTPKGRTGSERALGHLPSSLMALTVAGLGVWAYFIVSVMGYSFTTYKRFNVVAVALFFLVLNLIVLFLALERATSWRFAADRRGARRFETAVRITLNGNAAMLGLPSLTGGLVTFGPRLAGSSTELQVGDRVAVGVADRFGDQTLVGSVRKSSPEGSAVAFDADQWAGQAALSRAVFASRQDRVGADGGQAGVVISFGELFSLDSAQSEGKAAA